MGSKKHRSKKRIRKGGAGLGLPDFKLPSLTPSSLLTPDITNAVAQLSGTGSSPPPAAPAAKPKAAAEPKGPNVLNSIFIVLYKLIAAFILIVMAILLLASVIDIIRYGYEQSAQVFTQLVNPNIFNVDTLDMSTLMYFKNNINEEPYTIYFQQEMVKVLFNLALSAFVLLMVQVAIFVILVVYKKVKGEDAEDKLDFSEVWKEAIIIIMGTVSAFVLHGYYESRFLGALQPDLKGAHSTLISIKNYLYDNISTNSKFLAALQSGNLQEATGVMNQQTNLSIISRMVFTMSLYNFYKINISENEEAFTTVIQKIFTPREVELREINPIDYMYYNQNVFIPNLYPMIRKYIYGNDKAINTVAREKTLRDDIAYRINEANKRLMYLFKIPTKRDSVRNYMIFNLFIVAGLSAVVGFMYMDRIKEYIGKGVQFINDKINQKKEEETGDKEKGKGEGAGDKKKKEGTGDKGKDGKGEEGKDKGKETGDNKKEEVATGSPAPAATAATSPAATGTPTSPPK